MTNRLKMHFWGPPKKARKNKSTAKKKAEYVAKPGFSLDQKIFAARV